MGSLASLNPDELGERNEDRLRRLKSLAGQSLCFLYRNTNTTGYSVVSFDIVLLCFNIGFFFSFGV
jgi:hypothetical protein